MMLDPRGPRFSAACTSLVLVAVLVTGSGWLMLAQAVVFAIGTYDPRRTPYGLVICSARTFTRDYDETVQYWNEQGAPLWGTIPERVAIASGPDRSLSPDGMEAYRPLWRRAVRATRG